MTNWILSCEDCSWFPQCRKAMRELNCKEMQARHLLKVLKERGICLPKNNSVTTIAEDFDKLIPLDTPGIVVFIPDSIEKEIEG